MNHHPHPALSGAASPQHAIACDCPSGMGRAARITSWVLQIIAAVILAQTLFFKFTAAEEPVYIFTKLGAEPWGRIGSGVAELVAAVLLLIPRTVIFGAALSAGVMVGAIGAHLGPLGIVVKDDGGLLFGLGVVTFVAATIILVLRRKQVLHAISSILGKRPTGSSTHAPSAH